MISYHYVFTGFYRFQYIFSSLILNQKIKIRVGTFESKSWDFPPSFGFKPITLSLPTKIVGWAELYLVFDKNCNSTGLGQMTQTIFFAFLLVRSLLSCLPNISFLGCLTSLFGWVGGVLVIWVRLNYVVTPTSLWVEVGLWQW